MFEINLGKGKPCKPVSPSKTTKEAEKAVEQGEQPVTAEESAVNEVESGTNNNNISIEEDELIIKDDIDNDCFEEVDRIGEIEKEVREPCGRDF